MLLCELFRFLLLTGAGFCLAACRFGSLLLATFFFFGALLRFRFPRLRLRLDALRQGLCLCGGPLFGFLRRADVRRAYDAPHGAGRNLHALHGRTRAGTLLVSRRGLSLRVRVPGGGLFLCPGLGRGRSAVLVSQSLLHELLLLLVDARKMILDLMPVLGQDFHDIFAVRIEFFRQFVNSHCPTSEILASHPAAG